MKQNSALIRLPFVAGQFYPQDRRELDHMLSWLISQSGIKTSGRPIWALILPHAGYVYSAKTALNAMLPMRGRQYRRVVVIAPSHRYPFTGLAVSDFEAYETPLGSIPVDSEAVRFLTRLDSPLISKNNDAHQYEHALEVELPLLQKILPSEFKIVPLICGSLSALQAGELVPAMKELHGPETLWIVSSDFTHYGRSFNYLPFKDNIAARLEQLDRRAVELISNIDLPGWEAFLAETGATICGANPIKLLLAMAPLLEPSSEIKLEDYTTSGAITGDYSHCVSYCSISFSRRN